MEANRRWTGEGDFGIARQRIEEEERGFLTDLEPFKTLKSVPVKKC